MIPALIAYSLLFITYHYLIVFCVDNDLVLIIIRYTKDIINTSADRMINSNIEAVIKKSIKDNVIYSKNYFTFKSVHRSGGEDFCVVGYTIDTKGKMRPALIDRYKTLELSKKDFCDLNVALGASYVI